MESMQLLVAFLVNIVKSVVDLMQQNIFLQWSLYVFIGASLLKAFSVIWSHGSSKVSSSSSSRSRFSLKRKPREITYNFYYDED